jgi:hypothetical protein
VAEASGDDIALRRQSISTLEVVRDVVELGYGWYVYIAESPLWEKTVGENFKNDSREKLSSLKRKSSKHMLVIRALIKFSRPLGLYPLPVKDGMESQIQKSLSIGDSVPSQQ